jgi:trk system potassium uptake protein
MTTRVLVVGGGRVGTALALLLHATGKQVSVLDDRRDVLARLRDGLGPEAVHDGSPTDPAALEAAGVRRADVVVACTAADEHNLVITGLARFHFGVPRTVARIVDPARAWMYVEEMGVDAAINQADIIAHVTAEEMSLGDMMLLLKLRRGRYSLVEERVHPTAMVVGRRLDDVPVPADSAIVAVLRDGQPLLRDPAVVLQAGDEVLAVVHAGAADDLAIQLGPRPASTDPAQHAR